MKLMRALLFGLLLSLVLLLGSCRKLTWVGWIAILYYPQDPRVCPDGVYVGLDLPSDAKILGVSYLRDDTREMVPMLDTTSFLVTKPALAPSTPEEAVSGPDIWNGSYNVAVQMTDGTIRLHFHCEGSGRTQGEEGHVAPYDWRDFVLVEDPGRTSGIEVRAAEP